MKNTVAYYRSNNYQDINIEAYLPLVNRVVNQLNIKESSIIDRDDLLSIGVMGLLDATKKYNSKKKAAFETYAKFRIRGAILDELRNVGVLSRNAMKQVKEYYAKREELTQLVCHEPTDEEICEYMGITKKELSKIFLNSHYLSTASLEQAIYDGEGRQTSLLDTLADKSESTLIKLQKRDMYEELVAAIESLDQRDQYILNFYYIEELSLAQMSEILEISVSRVSQLHGRAICNLRAKLEHSKE